MARTYVTDELVTILLADVLTQAERTLLEVGQDELVKSTRSCLSEALEADTAKVIRLATGREVAASMSAQSLRPDFVTFTFVFGPRVSA